MNTRRLSLVVALLLNIGFYHSKVSNIFRNDQRIISQSAVNKNKIGYLEKHSSLKNPTVFHSGTVVENVKDDFISIRLNKQDVASKYVSTYYGEITIGEDSSNKMNVLFDTGSSEFWIPFESCTSSQCSKHNRYKKSPSFKYKYDNKGSPSLLEINYLSGSIQGFDGYDTVKLGTNLEIPHTNISFATNIEIPILEDFKWDGIVGLGFENEDSRKRGIKTFLDHVVESKVLSDRNYRNIFGYYLSDSGGMITFGGINNSLKRTQEEDFVWTPVSTELGFWTIDILGVRKEKMANIDENEKDELVVRYEGFHDGGKRSIVDTGTFLMYAPKKTMENYLSDLKVNSCDDKKNLPHLIFQIKATPLKNIKGMAVIELTLSPDDYVVEYINEETLTNECILGIQADDQYEEDHIEGWTLGQVFLKSFYTIFDKDNLLIGFVRSKKGHSKQNLTQKSFINLRTSKKNNYNGPL